MGPQFVGIDIGTSTISGIIFDPETRNLRSVTKKNTSRLEPENPWEDLQDPHIILSIVEEILDEFFASPEEIRGIGITGQMHGILYVNKDGNSRVRFIRGRTDAEMPCIRMILAMQIICPFLPDMPWPQDMEW